MTSSSSNGLIILDYYNKQPPSLQWLFDLVYVLQNLAVCSDPIHYKSILTSTEYDSLCFLRKLIVIHCSVETDRTESYTLRISIGQNLHQSKKNHGLHEIITMMPDSNSHRRRYSFFFYLTY